MTDPRRAVHVDVGGTRASNPLRRLPPMTLRRRIVGSVAALSALGLLGAGGAALVVERHRIEQRVERLLAQEVAEFRELAVTGVDPSTGRPFATADRLLEISMQRNVPDDNEVHLGFLPDVTLVPADGLGSLDTDGAFRELVTRHTQPTFGEVDVEGQGRVTYAALPVTKAGQVSHYVAVYFTDRELGELADTIRSYALAALVAWAGLVFAAWVLAGRILHPVRELQDTASSISASDLSRRIDVTGGDELAALGRTFNGMLDRLQEVLGSQRRMLDDAGHELRTPITVIRGHLEVMDAEDVDDVEAVRALALDELDRMSGLVEDLIVLAKTRLPEFLATEPIDVGNLVRRTLDKAQALGNRTWEVDAAPSVVAVVDPRRITQALLQLAANAVTATRVGDVVAIGCAPTPNGVQIWVRDSGPGVPPEDRQHIFDRWHRGDDHVDGEGGTGLGLAIVRAIATAHGGTAWVTAAGPSGGARFVIELPEGDLATEEDDDAGEDRTGDDRGAETAEAVPHEGPRGREEPAYVSLESLLDEQSQASTR
ncbi:sensor histidine kinase [Knoellia sp. CPCC 206435]|uniref:sensor histidine kinase n=1 Tax=Knoellia terrae TaxID=3404797 RepID=UPI003B429F14